MVIFCVTSFSDHGIRWNNTNFFISFNSTLQNGYSCWYWSHMNMVIIEKSLFLYLLQLITLWIWVTNDIDLCDIDLGYGFSHWFHTLEPFALQSNTKQKLIHLPFDSKRQKKWKNLKKQNLYSCTNFGKKAP